MQINLLKFTPSLRYTLLQYLLNFFLIDVEAIRPKHSKKIGYAYLILLIFKSFQNVYKVNVQLVNILVFD